MSNFVEIRDRKTNRFLFKFDPVRDIVVVPCRGDDVTVDLSQYREQPKPPDKQKEEIPGSGHCN